MNTQSEERSLRDYWHTLVRRRWVAFSFFVICTATVALGTFLMTPLYRASTTMLVEGENASVQRAEESSPSMNFDIFENYLETQMALLRSRSIAGKVESEFKLSETERYRQREGLGVLFQKKFTDDIHLERLPGTRMVAVSVDHPEAHKAMELANRLTEIYAQENLSRRSLSYIRNQRMGALNAEFSRLQEQYDSLSKQFGPMYPAMIDLKKQIDAMARRIAGERTASEAAPGSPRAGESAVEATLLKIQEDSVVSSSRMNNILIVDTAVVPSRIHSPKRLLNLLLGLFAGLVGGILLAFLVDYLDDSIKTYEDLKRRIGDRDYLGSVFSERGKFRQDVERLVAHRSESPSAEAYRLIRTAIVWFIRKENAIKDIAILSAGPGEGKTTIASNLAIALSQINLKVLFVDTDLRRGRLHEIYGLDNGCGLGQCLTDGLPLAKVTRDSGLPNLSVVTCGSSIINSSQLFSSPRMAEFILEARQRYDLVIYDTAPLTIISDTTILLTQLSAAVLSVRSGVTNARSLPKVFSTIQESKTQFMGVVLNSVVSSDNPYYNKYYQRK